MAAMKITVFWVITIAVWWIVITFLEDRKESFYPEDEGNRILKNIGTCLPDCKVSQLRRLIIL
jgi:hypothetical protein